MNEAQAPSRPVVHYVVSPTGEILGRRLRALAEIELNWKSEACPDMMVTLFYNAFPEKEAAQQFLEAHDAATWPRTSGESHLPHLYDVVSSLLRAHHPKCLTLDDSRLFPKKAAVITAVAKRWGLHGVATRFDVTRKTVSKRWPRLYKHLRCAGMLSATEADGMLITVFESSLAVRRNPADARFHGEAVSHYGGPHKLLLGALRWHRMELRTRLAHRDALKNVGGSVDFPRNVRLQRVAGSKEAYTVFDTHFEVSLAYNAEGEMRRFTKWTTAYNFAENACRKSWPTQVFQRAVQAVLKKVGAELRGDTGGVSTPHWRLKTCCGALEIRVYDDWVACRFHDSEAAKKVLGGGWGFRLGLTGKWNFHGNKDELQSLALEFERELNALLARQPSAQRA